MSTNNMIEAEVAFSSITKHDVYRGKDTGNFTLTVILDKETAAELESNGVQVKEYEGKLQRKFKSQYDVGVIDVEGSPFEGEIPWGAKVRILFGYGQPHADYGVPVYMNKIRVLGLRDPEAAPEVAVPSDF